MAHDIEVLNNPQEFKAAVEEIGSGTRNELILGKWGGGLLEFAGVAFPDVDISDIYAKRHEREPGGRDPHFDVYKEFVDADRPWAGHFNLSGNAIVETVTLPEDLAAVYARRYPVQTAESAMARRHLSRFALEEPDADVGRGYLEALTRFVLPVRPNGPHIVHNIVPINPEKPGEFVKLIVPPRTRAERDDLRSIDYLPLDSFLTQLLGTKIPDEERPIEKNPQIFRKPVSTPRVPIRHVKARCRGID